MAFTLRKTSGGGTIGLDIDGRYLAAAQVANGRVTQSASHELPEGLVRDGEVADVQALADQLKSFASEAGLPRNTSTGVQTCGRNGQAAGSAGRWQRECRPPDSAPTSADSL
jgi:hypothetical protein